MSSPLGADVALHSHVVLPPGPRQRVEAEAWLERTVAGWALQPGLAGRWLVAADTHLRGDDESTVAVEYDPGSQICTVEIWRNRRRIFGIDDWVGSW